MLPACDEMCHLLRAQVSKQYAKPQSLLQGQDGPVNAKLASSVLEATSSSGNTVDTL